MLSDGYRYFAVVGYAEVIWERAYANKPLKEHLSKAKKIHDNDLKNCFGSLYLSYEWIGKYQEVITYM